MCPLLHRNQGSTGTRSGIPDPRIKDLVSGCYPPGHIFPLLSLLSPDSKVTPSGKKVLICSLISDAYKLPPLPYSSLQVGYSPVRLAGAASKGQMTGKLWRGKEFGAATLGIATEGSG